MFYKFFNFKCLKVHHYIFRPIWSSSCANSFFARKLLSSVVAYVVKYIGSPDAHVFELVSCVLSCCMLCCVSQGPPDAHVFELVGCVLSCCVLCCVSQGPLEAHVFELVGCVLSCCVLCCVSQGPPEAHVFGLVGCVLSCCVLCCVSQGQLDAHMCLSWWVVFSLVCCDASRIHSRTRNAAQHTTR
jgi:hypothetical protein